MLVAGDPERIHIAKCEKDGGITYHSNLINLMVNTHNSLNRE